MTLLLEAKHFAMKSFQLSSDFFEDETFVVKQIFLQLFRPWSGTFEISASWLHFTFAIFMKIK